MRDCEHGVLKRSCEICQRDKEITELKGRLKTAYGLLQHMIDCSAAVNASPNDLIVRARYNKCKRFCEEMLITDA